MKRERINTVDAFERGFALLSGVMISICLMTLFLVVAQLGIAQIQALQAQYLAVQIAQAGYQNIQHPTNSVSSMMMVADLMGESATPYAPLTTGSDVTLDNGMTINILHVNNPSTPDTVEAKVWYPNAPFVTGLFDLTSIETGAAATAIGNLSYLSLLVDNSQSLTHDHSILWQAAIAGLWDPTGPIPVTTPDEAAQLRLPFAVVMYNAANLYNIYVTPTPNSSGTPFPDFFYESTLSQYLDGLLAAVETPGSNPARPWSVLWPSGFATPTPAATTGGAEIALPGNLPPGQYSNLINLTSDALLAYRRGVEYAAIALSPIFDKVDISLFHSASVYGPVKEAGGSTDTMLRGSFPLFKHEWGDPLTTWITTSDIFVYDIPNYSGS